MGKALRREAAGGGEYGITQLTTTGSALEYDEV